MIVREIFCCGNNEDSDDGGVGGSEPTSMAGQ